MREIESRLKVGGSRVGECRGWIMLLEAEQADRSGRDAFVRGVVAESARRKDWERYPGHVSRNPKQRRGAFDVFSLYTDLTDYAENTEFLNFSVKIGVIRVVRVQKRIE